MYASHFLMRIDAGHPRSIRKQKWLFLYSFDWLFSIMIVQTYEKTLE